MKGRRKVSWRKERTVGGKEGVKGPRKMEKGSEKHVVAGHNSQQWLQIQVFPFRQVFHYFRHFSGKESFLAAVVLSSA